MSSQTPIQENLVKSNTAYASTFTQGHLALPPSQKYAVVTCMDARIDPARAFGIPLGSAHIIRNGGGSARDALRSLVISEQLLGTNEIILIKHTGCGMLTFKNEDAVGIVQKNISGNVKQALEEGFQSDFQPFGNLEVEVEKDVKFLKENVLIPKEVNVSGWIYEVENGRVRRVV